MPPSDDRPDDARRGPHHSLHHDASYELTVHEDFSGPDSGDGSDALVNVTNDLAQVGRRVRAGVYCAHCSHHLRGEDRHGYCPRCGLSVHRSLHAYLLYYSDPRVLARMSLGALMLLASYAAAGFLQYGSLLGVDPIAAVSRFPFAPGSTAMGYHACWLLFLAGGWLLTWPEPAMQPRGRDTQGACDIDRAGGADGTGKDKAEGRNRIVPAFAERRVSARRVARLAVAWCAVMVGIAVAFERGVLPQDAAVFRYFDPRLAVAFVSAFAALCLGNLAVDLALRNEDHGMAERMKYILLLAPLLLFTHVLAGEGGMQALRDSVEPLALRVPVLFALLFAAAGVVVWLGWAMLRAAWMLYAASRYARRASLRVRTEPSPRPLTPVLAGISTVKGKGESAGGGAGRSMTRTSRGDDLDLGRW